MGVRKKEEKEGRIARLKCCVITVRFIITHLITNNLILFITKQSAPKWL